MAGLCVRACVRVFFFFVGDCSERCKREGAKCCPSHCDLSLPDPPPPDLLLPTSKVSDSTVITPNGVPGPLHTLPEFKRRLKTIIEVRGGGAQ